MACVQVLRVLSQRMLKTSALHGGRERLSLGRGVACDRGAGVLYAIDDGGGGPEAAGRQADGDGVGGGRADGARFAKFALDGDGAEGGGGGGGPRRACIRKLQLHSGEGDLLLGTSGSGVALAQPEGLALSDDGGLLCVADAGRHTVLHLTCISPASHLHLGWISVASRQVRGGHRQPPAAAARAARGQGAARGAISMQSAINQYVISM